MFDEFELSNEDEIITNLSPKEFERELEQLAWNNFTTSFEENYGEEH
jgi:hypothetical protein